MGDLGYLVIAVFCALSAGIVAKLRGNSFFIWFIVGLVLPILGTVLALLMRRDDHELRRQCPECNNVVSVTDQVCMRCGRDLEFPEHPLVSRAVERRLRAGGALADGE